MALTLDNVNKTICFNTFLILLFLWTVCFGLFETPRTSTSPVHVEVPKDPSTWIAGESISPSYWQEEAPIPPSETPPELQDPHGVDTSPTLEQGALIEAIISPPEPSCSSCPSCPTLQHVQVAQTQPTTNSSGSRPLILYAYSESKFARQNLEFFISHGLHAAADFIFILNGETDVEKSLIFKPENKSLSNNETVKYDKVKTSRHNISVKRRNNTCFDLGAHWEVLSHDKGGEGWFGVDGAIPSTDAPMPAGQLPQHVQDRRPLKERYKRFILMNASIRGPFVPGWSGGCWSDAYLDKLTSKLVGMSYNCHVNRGHIQSMIWATDSVGLQTILSPSGIGECFSSMATAIDGEVRTTKALREAGYEVEAFMSVFHSKDGEGKENGEWWRDCHDEDYLDKGAYFGTFVHPYENLFMKSHRGIEDTVLDRLTEWHDGRGVGEAYEMCH